METSTAETLLVLGRQFGFTPDDLAANRQGQITPTQIKRLNRLGKQADQPLTAETQITILTVILEYRPEYDESLHRLESALIPEGELRLYFLDEKRGAVYETLLEPIDFLPAGSYALHLIMYSGREYILSIEPVVAYHYLNADGTLREDAFDGLLFLLLFRVGDTDGYVARIGDYLKYLYGSTAVFWNFSVFDPAIRIQAVQQAALKSTCCLLVIGQEWESPASVAAYQEPDDPLHAAFTTETDAGFFVALVNDIATPITIEGVIAAEKIFHLSDHSFTYDLQKMIAELETYDELDGAAIPYLSQRFPYDDKDVAANLDGKVSWGQLNWLMRRDFRWLTSLVIFVFPPLVLFLMTGALWQRLTWFAVGTLVTGSILVGAGFMVGLWQTVILRKLHWVEGYINLQERFLPDRFSIRTDEGHSVLLRFPFETTLNRAEWQAMALRRYKVGYCIMDGDNYLLSILPAREPETTTEKHTAALTSDFSLAPLMVVWHSADLSLSEAEPLISYVQTKLLEAQVGWLALGGEKQADLASIEQVGANTQAVITLIGKNWQAHAQFDSPDDPLRILLARAQLQNAEVIPVLLDGAGMPSRESLSETYKTLAKRNAVPFYTHRTAFAQQRLVTAIAALPTVRDKQNNQAILDFGFVPEHLVANRAGQIPDEQRQAIRKRMLALYIYKNLVAMAVAAGLAAGVLLMDLPTLLIAPPTIYIGLITVYCGFVGAEIYAPLRDIKSRVVRLQFQMNTHQQGEMRFWRTIAFWLENEYDRHAIDLNGTACTIFDKPLSDEVIQRWKDRYVRVYYVEPSEAFFLSLEIVVD